MTKIRPNKNRFQVVLLEVLSVDTGSGQVLSDDSDVMKLLISITVESPNVQNRQTSLTTLAVLMNLSQTSRDLFRIWLHLANVSGEETDKLCEIISTALIQRHGLKNDADEILEKYPALNLNKSLLSLIRSKALKKKFKTLFFEALTQMASCDRQI